MTDLSRYLDSTLDSIFARPPMWGGPEAIELQVLLLLEIKAVLGGAPDAHAGVMGRYEVFLREVGDRTAHLLSGQTSDIERLAAHLAEFRRREATQQSAAIVALSAALETRAAAEARVVELRRTVIQADEPRTWSFSHAGVHDRSMSYPAQADFAYSTLRRAEVEAQLRDAMQLIPFDRTQGSYQVRATATCALTNESVSLDVAILQTP